MAVFNSTLLEPFIGTAIDPLVTTINQVMSTLQVLVGGLFGLYLLFFIYKVVSLKRIKNEIHSIASDIHGIRERIDKLEKKKKT